MTSLQAQHPPFGSLMKEWRQRRRLSQLDLAIEADVSSRHVSFIETGRSAPSRAMVLRLATALDVPLREQNQLLMAAGLAPVYSERSLEDPDMGAVRDGIDQVLKAYEPFPCLAVDRGTRLPVHRRWGVCGTMVGPRTRELVGRFRLGASSAMWPALSAVRRQACAPPSLTGGF